MQNTGSEWGLGKVTELRDEETMTNQIAGVGGNWTNKGEEVQTRWVEHHSLCELHVPTCRSDCEGDTTL